MKTNIFRVREKKEKKIIIEEEHTKNPLLLFFKRHKNFLMLLLITLLVCLLLASVGIAFSLFRGSNDYDISYISGSEDISTNNDPNIDDDDVKEGLLGEEARSEGVVVLVETFMSNQGDVVSYYSDGTAIVVQSNGNIYRIFPKDNGNYGIDKNGKIDSKVKKILVTSTSTSLTDGTVVTYYSDGSAKVELNGENIFVRDSNNIKIEGGSSFSYVNPSGVALAKDNTRLGQAKVITFSDGTTLIINGSEKIIVNKNTKPSIDNGNVSYDKNNIFNVIGEQTLDDGNIITHYGNGSATITDPKGNVIYVKKAGDIIVKNKKLYEIITNPYGFSRTIVNCPDGKKVVYFDNGAAVIIQRDGTRLYVEDNTEIIYDGSKNISSVPTSANQISQKKTKSGDVVYNFDNGKSQVIKSDGTSYIIDTDKLVFAADGNIIKEPVEVEKNEKPKEESDYDPTKGLYVSEAEHKYGDKKNVTDSTFIIRNDNNKNRTLKITIVEISNYSKFNTFRLDPRFVKFQATVGDDYVSARPLNSKEWKDSSNRVNYVIYDGIIGPKSTITVALSLYVDYTNLTNEYQDTGFLGTINVYVEDVVSRNKS